MRLLLLLLLMSTPAHADSWIPYVGSNPVSDTGSNGTGKAMFDTGPVIAGQISTGSVIVTSATPPSGDGFYDAAPGAIVAQGNGGPMAVFAGVSGGVNYPQFTNAASGGMGSPATVLLQAKGTDADILFFMSGKGNQGVIMTPGGSSGKGLIVKGFSGQSVNIFEIWNSSSSVIASIDKDGVIDTSQKYKVNGTQVIGARITGWGTQSGTPSRAALATYTAPTISNPPTQAQVQALANEVQALSQHFKAAADDLATHGLIGP